MGEPLRSEMETLFGHDFSTVRVHQNSGIAQIGAVALAHGEKLHFAPGRYQPGTSAGRRVISHELTHVVQQRQGSFRGTGGSSETLEEEATGLGERAANGQFCLVHGAARGPQLMSNKAELIQQLSDNFNLQLTADEIAALAEMIINESPFFSLKPIDDQWKFLSGAIKRMKQQKTEMLIEEPTEDQQDTHFKEPFFPAIHIIDKLIHGLSANNSYPEKKRSEDFEEEEKQPDEGQSHPYDKGKSYRDYYYRIGSEDFEEEEKQPAEGQSHPYNKGKSYKDYYYRIGSEDFEEEEQRPEHDSEDRFNLYSFETLPPKEQLNESLGFWQDKPAHAQDLFANKEQKSEEYTSRATGNLFDLSPLSTRKDTKPSPVHIDFISLDQELGRFDKSADERLNFKYAKFSKGTQADRPKNIKNLSKEEIDIIYRNGDNFFENIDSKGTTLSIIFSMGDNQFEFTTIGSATSITPEELGKNLLIKHYLLFGEEPQPRSGKARAAADTEKGTLRRHADKEAQYASHKTFISPKSITSNLPPVGKSKMSIEFDGGKVTNTLEHKGSWKKGDRGKGQIDLMGGQNAKNYMKDHISSKTQGRWEWLHIIGSSLGGFNAIGNLVAGTYDANTRMIPLEHKIANWGKTDYQNNARSDAGKILINDYNPLTIIGTAKLMKETSSQYRKRGGEFTFAAEEISLKVLHGPNGHKREVIKEHSYKANDPIVITKSEYEEEERAVEQKIEEGKAHRQRF